MVTAEALPPPSPLASIIGAHKKRAAATPLQHTLIGGGAGVLEVCIMQPTVCVKNALQVCEDGCVVGDAAWPWTAATVGGERGEGGQAGTSARLTEEKKTRRSSLSLTRSPLSLSTAHTVRPPRPLD